MVLDGDTAWKIFRLTRNDGSWRVYQQLRKNCNEKGKNNFLYKIGSKSSKKMWGKSFIGVSENIESCEVVGKRCDVD